MAVDMVSAQVILTEDSQEATILDNLCGTRVCTTNGQTDSLSASQVADIGDSLRWRYETICAALEFELGVQEGAGTQDVLFEAEILSFC